jgi:hypothetical protein
MDTVTDSIVDIVMGSGMDTIMECGQVTGQVIVQVNGLDGLQAMYTGTVRVA